MTKIVSFISRKGGTGKTTNAINLTTMLYSLGYKVLLIETDNNYTLNTLRQMEVYKSGAKESDIFKIIGSDENAVVPELETLKKKNELDYIIIDSAGKTTDKNIRELCLASNAVIVPTSLSQNDLLVTYQTVEDIKQASAINNDLKILVLANRIHSSTKSGTVKAALQQLDAHVLDVAVPMKNLFANFSTILPEKEYLKATKEIISII